MSKNFVLIAPIFPYTFYQFAIGLKNQGFKVLVVGDVSEAYLPQALVEHMDGYYFVHDMNHYPNLIPAVAYFIERFGPIDYIESNIEHWLRYDAQLREDFNVSNGLRPNQLKIYQSKAKMKKFYEQANIPVARHQLLTTFESAKQFAETVGYPLFVKPDIGVGSQVSFKLKDESQLLDFFARKPEQPFILEEFIDGDIYSFDGMSNDTGEVVFYTGHHFPNNIASIVNEDAETYYVTLKHLPTELVEKGKAAVKAFGLNQRFFHFEFFQLKQDHPHLGKAGTFVALEANLRPPGGYTLEMINYANSVNAYHIYADVIATNSWQKKDQYPTFYCANASRKNHHQYRYDFQAIREKYGQAIVFENSYHYPISIAMGDYFFLAKFNTREEVESFFQFVLAK
jgi:hypothetical protein